MTGLSFGSAFPPTERSHLPHPGRARRRLPSALVLLLHAAVALLAPVADARLSGEALAEVHLETPESPSCPPPHDHLRCQLCRQAESRLLAASGFRCLPGPLAVVSPSPIPFGVERRAATRLLPVGPRAPPAS